MYEVFSTSKFPQENIIYMFFAMVLFDNRNYNNLEMKIETRQKFNDIFEIKINQTNLSRIINNFYQRITSFQQIIETIDTKINDELYSQKYESRILYLIHKEIDFPIFSLNQKLEERDKEFQRLSSSYTNYQINIQKELTTLSQQAKQYNFKLFQINNFNQLKHSQTLQAMSFINTQIQQKKVKQDSIITQIAYKLEDLLEQKENQFTMKEEIERLQHKMAQFQEQINCSIKQHIKLLKFTALKNTDSIQQNITDDSKEDETQNNNRNNKHLQKSKFNVRKSIGCTLSTNKTNINDSLNFNSFQLQNDFKALKEKVQQMDNKLFVLAQNQRRTYKEIQRNDSENSIRYLQVPKKGTKNGRCSRMSINTIKNSQVLNEQKSYFDSNSIQIKTINDKLKKMQLKHQIIDENYNNMLQKIHKLSNLQVKVQSKIDEAQKLRVDLGTINEINTSFKKMSSLIEIQETKYVLQNPYHKDITAVNCKLQNHLFLLGKMAKKEEIKEAIIFLQNKLKQIVIILTQKFQNQKKGAINKIQNLKCLTCDKDNSNFHSTENIRHLKTSHHNRFPFDTSSKEYKRNRTIGNQ